MADREMGPPEVNVEYAVGITRRRALVLEAGLDFQLHQFARIVPEGGARVRYEDGTEEVVHLMDVQVPWEEHVAREQAKVDREAEVTRMVGEIEALGVKVRNRPSSLPGRETATVNLDQLYAVLVEGEKP